MNNKISKKYGPLFFIFIGTAAIVYLFFVLSAPIATSSPALQAYTTKIKFVRLVLSVGYIIFWFCGAYAITKLETYNNLIKGHTESDAFKKIYQGLVILTAGMVLWPVVSSSRATVLQNPDLVRGLTMLFNYTMILPTLMGFYLINKGSKKLLAVVDIKKTERFSNLLPGLVLFLALPIYLWLIFTNPQRSVTSAGVPSTFYLPDYLILLTIVLPAMASWVLGLLAVVKLRLFQTKAPGLVYKRSLPALYHGLAGVILGSLFLQGIVSLGTNRLLGLSHVLLVLTVYTFAGMLAIGYFLIARGTKSLTKIETIP